MKRSLLLVFVAAFLGVEFAGAQPSATGDNGVLGFNLNSYGRFRVSKSPYTSSAREVDRMSFIAALSEEDVFDYNEDGDSTSVTAAEITIPGVDAAYQCITDNEYSGEPPAVRVVHTVMSWNSTPYVFIRFQAVNTTAAPLELYLGAAVIPRPSQTYGSETVAYDAAGNTAYYYRTGETPYWGTRLLNKPAYSVKIRDWDAYSPNPDSDEATDSTRYAMTAASGFDDALTVGANGSIYHHNGGLVTIAAGDTAELVYAVVYGTSLSELLAASAAAQTRYDAIFTAVEASPADTPTGFALQQNYPNPFNPATQIHFTLARPANVQLAVYDASGREVSRLLNGRRPAGEHVVTFEARGLTSGVYFYKLRTGEFTATRKMLLVR
ncbi:T9SS type A sorting domain-containing protein [candidate division KSB1 bacterium]|nr:T9SS type A sorting domain-containing protein [bacterium]NUM66055.1 T9SS type A sorting domain-containing protein [candidate division KSB1 bacterium]